MATWSGLNDCPYMERKKGYFCYCIIIWMQVVNTDFTPQRPRRHAKATQNATNTRTVSSSRERVKYIHPFSEIHTV